MPLGSDSEAEDDEFESENGQAEVSAEGEGEPLLKYCRLAPSMAALLASEPAKCLIAHEKFLVLGTEKGNVYILDLFGDELVKKKISCHASAINDMSLDDTGEMIATCSNDGMVVISDIWSEGVPQLKYQYTKPVYAVALANNFKLSQSFAAGGQAQQLILNSKTWYSTREKIIHSGEGPITTIRWNGDIIAWANAQGVKIYDCRTLERISSINRSHGQHTMNGGGGGTTGSSTEVVKCCLAWANKETLLIGWGNSVRVGVVKQRVSEQPNALPVRFFQIASVFHTEFSIYGLAPFGEQQIAFLTCTRESDQKTERAEFRVLTWGADEIINDSLSLYGLDEGISSDISNKSSGNGNNGGSNSSGSEISLQFTWCGETSKPIFYIVSPKDVVIARHRDLDDHIQWLVDRGKIEEALTAAEEDPAGLSQFNLSDIAHTYLDELFVRGEYKTAASNCPRLLKTDVDLWEKRIALFAQHRQLQMIAEYIPTTHIRLSPFIYELVLNEFCLEDPKGLLDLINKWDEEQKATNSSNTKEEEDEEDEEEEGGEERDDGKEEGKKRRKKGGKKEEEKVRKERRKKKEEVFLEVKEELYNTNNVLHAVQERLARLEQDLTITTNRSFTPEDLQNAKQMKQKSTEYILEVLSILYVKTKRFADAVHVKLRLGRSDLFDLVANLKLFDTIKDQLLLLMNFNAEKAAELFVENLDALPIENVILQLQTYPKHLHRYLHLLFLKDKNIGYKYHGKQVQLYAEYQPDMLMNFLKVSTQYLPEDALKVCEKYSLWEEMVYLLRNMGDPNRALKLLVLKVQDVQKAITFVEEHKDEQLWEELITLSLDRPEFLSDLLEHVGTHYVDMVRLIPRIPNDLKIPHLKLKLIKIFSDQQAQINVREGCNRILREDCRTLQSRSYSFQQQAWFVGVDSKCEKCLGPILSRRERDNVVVFSCTHSYHAQCIEPYRTDRSSPIMCIQCSSLGQTHASSASSDTPPRRKEEQKFSRRV